MGVRDNLVNGFRTALGGTVPSVNNYQSPWGGTDWWGMDGTVDESGAKKKGVYTAAFWLSPPYGRPRDIDYQRLERLEKSVWVRMCVQHIVDSVAGAEWEIVPRIKGAEVSESSMAEVQKFFDGESWAEGMPVVLKQMLPDMLQYDAGVLLKAFAEKDFDSESGELKEGDGLVPLELYARDGRSFLKDADLFGNLKQYWQYSWINPQGKPIQFSPDEVMYLQQYPVSREPYGMSTLEIIEEILDYLSQSTVAQSKYWTNGMFIGGQIDMPEIKDLDELKRWQAYFEAKLRGPRKFGKWLVTGGGTKVQSLPFTPQQMQWIDSQKWFTKIVFAVFKVAPSELGFTEDLNRATGIQQMEIHKSKAIRPVLTLLENAFNRQIVWKYFDSGLKFQYVQNLSLDEKQKQTEIDVKRLDAGLDSVNELRDRDGLVKWDDPKYDAPVGEGSDDSDSGEDEEEFDWDALMGKYAKGGVGSGIKGHKTAKKDMKKIVSYDKVSMYDLGFGKDGKAAEQWLLDHGWEFDKRGEVQVTSGYGVAPVYDVYLDKGKAVAASITDGGFIEHLEVNKAQRGKGVGTKIMADIAVELLKEGKGEAIILNSQGDESNKFYDAIGMRKTNEDFEDYVPEDDPEGDDVYYEGGVEWQKEFVKALLGKEVLKVVGSEIDIKGSLRYDPLVGTKKDRTEKLLKAAMAAMSGEAGYVPIPYAYDEEGEPKKKADKVLDGIIKQMYESMKDKVDDSVEYLLRE